MTLLLVGAGIALWWIRPDALFPVRRPEGGISKQGPGVAPGLPSPLISMPPTTLPMPSAPAATNDSAESTPTNRTSVLETAESDLNQIPDRVPTNILEAQITLTAYGIGSGPIDGVGGAQTAWALRAFQFQRGLEETGRLDRDTQAELKPTRPWFRSYTVAPADLIGLQPTPGTWLGKSEVNRLGYQSVLELVAEQFHASSGLLRRLNPAVNWEAITPGVSVIVPNAENPPPRRAALVRISLANRYLRAFDGRGNLLAHFPCSIGRIAEKRPVGELRVVVAAEDPNYTFDPAVFPESAEARQIGRKLIIPPGPNNPVGVAWIGLSRPGYGIHGTPEPEKVGRTESHGCFRLANWNAKYLLQMVVVGTPVWVEL